MTGAAFWPTLRLIVSAVLLTSTAIQPVLSQDWMPFHIAARMAPSGEWTLLYPDISARSLFDVSEAYRAAARRPSQAGTDVRSSEVTLTAFVSPPPSAFALVPFRAMSFAHEQILWRLTLTVLLVLVLFGGDALMGDAPSRNRWSWLALATTPLLMYVVFIGQSSAWLVVAAALSVVRATRARDALGGIALGIAVVFKATPAIAVAGLWLAGRRRLATIATAVSFALALVALPWIPLDAWWQFAGITKRLATVIVPDWNNAAVDAALLRPLAGTTSAFHEPDAISRGIGLVTRIVLVLVALYQVRRAAQPSQQAAAAWIAWLASTPLLWLHYLAVLIPLVGATPVRRVDPGAIALASIAAVVLGRVTGATPFALGTVLCAAWLASALWLLSNGCWKTKRRSTSDVPPRGSGSARRKSAAPA